MKNCDASGISLLWALILSLSKFVGFLSQLILFLLGFGLISVRWYILFIWIWLGSSLSVGFLLGSSFGWFILSLSGFSLVPLSFCSLYQDLVGFLSFYFCLDLVGFLFWLIHFLSVRFLMGSSLGWFILFLLGSFFSRFLISVSGYFGWFILFLLDSF